MHAYYTLDKHAKKHYSWLAALGWTAMKKVGQKNGEVGLLVEYLFCAIDDHCDLD